MTQSAAEFPPEYAAIEHQIDKALQEQTDVSRLATGKVPPQYKTLNNYEKQMRSHADRCVAGR